MELRRYLGLLRRRWLVILLTVVAAAGVTFTGTDRTPRYTASSTIYIGASSFGFGTDNQVDLGADRADDLQRLIVTFAVMIDSETVARDALLRTDLPRSAKSVVDQTSALPVINANLLRIEVVDTDPTVAQGLANGLADAFIDQIGALEPGGQISEGDLPSAPATLFERASLPTVPAGSSVLSNMIVAALFGFVVSAGLALLVDYLDVTLRTADEAERRLELPVLAVVPFLRSSTISGRPLPSAPRPELRINQDA